MQFFAIRLRRSFFVGIFGLAMLLWPAVNADAATLAEWLLSTDFAATNVAAGVTATDFSAGTGTTSFTVGSSGAYAKSWSTGTTDLTDFFEITLTAAPGQTITISDVQFGERRSGTGPREYDVQWSDDNFATNTTLTSVAVPDDDSERTGDLTGLSLTSPVGGTISIRWHGFSAESSVGTWRINNNTLKILGTIADVTAPTLSEATPVISPTNDTSPEMTFHSSEPGTLTTQGGCTTGTTSVTAGSNTISFDQLAEGTYTTCQLRVTDLSGNASNWLTLSPFEIDTTAPTVTAISAPAVADSTLSPTITATFDESMDQSVVPAISIADLAGSPYFGTCVWQNSTTCTATVTITDDDETAVGTITVSGGTDLAGNVCPPDSSGTVNVDTENPTLATVSIASNNADPTHAKIGETITVSVTPSEQLGSLSGTIFGRNAAANLATSTISLAGTGSDPEGTVAFSVNCSDVHGNTCATTSVTTDGSSVIFDRTDPVLSNFQTTIASNGTNPRYAKTGNAITLEFETNEPVLVPTGTILGHAAVPTSPDRKHWTVASTATNTDTEGVVAFSYTIHDLAGNNSLTVTATQNGTSVIFDRTAPDLSALTTIDLLNSESAGLKHRINASFSWNGAIDAVSGIATYSGTLSHSTLPGQIFSPQLGTSWTPLLLTPNDTPYTLAITATDHAGNFSTISPAYTQRYSIGISGIVRNTDGSLIDGATVQIVARYGEFCAPGREICTTTTNNFGTYSIVLNPSQSYTMNFYKNGHYLQKKDEPLGLIDHVVNASLAPITSRTEAQTLDSTVILTCSKAIERGSFGVRPTSVTVETNSGQVTTTSVADGFTVTSLGTIGAVTSNNPAVTITDLGGNIWKITGAGSVVHSTSLGSAYDSNKTHRLGIIRVDGGDIKSRAGMRRGEQVMHGHFWTETESKAYLVRLDAGEAPSIVTYINRNGYKIFAGYRPGKLPIARVSTPAKNTLQVRSAITAKQLAAAKLRFQNISEKTTEPRFFTKISRRVSAADTVINRHARLAATEVSNPFARHRAFIPIAGTLRTTDPYRSLVLRQGGRSVRLQRVFGTETIRH